jgi:hypothetical protein
VTFLELREELQDPRAALCRLIGMDVERRDALQSEAPPELVLYEARRSSEGGKRRAPLGIGPDDADPYLGVAEVRCRLDVGDRREPDPRVGDVAGEDRADLLAQQLIDAVHPLAHRGRPVPAGDAVSSRCG